MKLSTQTGMRANGIFLHQDSSDSLAHDVAILDGLVQFHDVFYAARRACYNGDGSRCGGTAAVVDAVAGRGERRADDGDGSGDCIHHSGGRAASEGRDDPQRAFWELAPWLVILLILAIAAVIVFLLPMEMRGNVLG